MHKITRQDWMATALGLLGLAGSFLSISFPVEGTPYGIIWSAVFPTIAALVYGRRGGAISFFAGFYWLYPFLVYRISGPGNIITMAITLAYLYLHGWAAEKRKQVEKPHGWHMMLIQVLYTAAILPVYLIGFSLLAPARFDMTVVFWFALKEGISGFLILASASALLTQPVIRRLMGLKTDDTYAYNGFAMLSVIAAGVVFLGLVGSVEFLLLEGKQWQPIWSRVSVSNFLFVGWLFFTFMLILGGKMALLLQHLRMNTNLVIEERNRFRNLFESIQDIYFESDMEGRILDVSPSVKKVMGYAREACIGHIFFNHPELMEKLQESGVLENDNFEHPMDSGQIRHLVINAKMVQQDACAPKILGILRDVTELELSRKQLQQVNTELEERVRARTAQLEEALRELETFSFTVSHDLKSPTRSIDSFCRFILEDYSDQLPEDAKLMLGNIHSICGHMIHFIQRLLDYAMASKKAYAPVRFSTKSIVDSVVQEMKASLSGRHVEFEITDTMPEICGDPILFQQIIANGLSNAVKFTASRACGQIQIDAVRDGNAYRFSLSDNGIGFEPSMGEHIFGMFTRLHMPETYEGAGIGLATVRICAKKMGGSVKMTGTPDAGAVLLLELPVDEVNEVTQDA